MQQRWKRRQGERGGQEVHFMEPTISISCTLAQKVLAFTAFDPLDRGILHSINCIATKIPAQKSAQQQIVLREMVRSKGACPVWNATTKVLASRHR
jgi:hypothetical protein